MNKSITKFLSIQTTFLPSIQHSDWQYLGLKRRLFPDYHGWVTLDFNQKSMPDLSDFISEIFRPFKTKDLKSNLILLQILLDFGQEKLKWFCSRLDGDVTRENIMRMAVEHYRELGMLYHLYQKILKLDQLL